MAIDHIQLKPSRRPPRLWSKKLWTRRPLAFTKTTLAQLARKKTILLELDAKIVDAIKDPGKLEGEIFETEEIQNETEAISGQISKLIYSSLPAKKPPGASS